MRQTVLAFFTVERPRRHCRVGRLGRVQTAAPCPRPQPLFCAGCGWPWGCGLCCRGGFRCICRAHKVPRGSGRRYRAGVGRAAAGAAHSVRRACRSGCSSFPSAVVRTPDTVARGGGRLGRGCSCSGRIQCCRIYPPEAPCGTGLQNAGRLLQWCLCCRSIHAGRGAPAHLYAGPRAGRSAAGGAAA